MITCGSGSLLLRVGREADVASTMVKNIIIPHST